MNEADEAQRRAFAERCIAALYQPWEVKPNDLIGGICIQPAGEEYLSQGGFCVADVVSEAHARHISLTHNQWLRRRRSGVQFRHAYGFAMTGIVLSIMTAGTLAGFAVYYHQPIGLICSGIILVVGAVCGGLAYWKAEDGK